MTEAPTRTSALVRRWRATTEVDEPDRGLARRPSGQAPPLSYAQERMWFLEQYVPGTAAYHMWLSFRLHGPLDLAAMDAALAGLVARHESLRMRFPTNVEGDPLIEVDPPGPARWAVLDVTGDGDRVQAARSVLQPALAAPFDLAAGPLLRPMLVRLAPDDHVVCLVVHHIVCDGWSAELMRDELLAGYDAARGGRTDGPPPLPLDYGDYAWWQRKQFDQGRSSAGLDFWRQKLTGVPALQLPTDRTYPAAQTANGATHSFRIDAGLCRAVERLAQAHRATSFMTLLAAYQVLLGWWCDQDDFAVGVPVSGRDQPEAEQLVGLFVNTLVFRTDLAGDPTFAALLARVREDAVTAYSYQQVPFERVVATLPLERDMRRPPVFQVSFALQNYAPARSRGQDRGSLEVASFGIEATATRHELVLYLYPQGDELSGVVNYNTDLFDEATIVALFERYLTLLRQVVANPELRLSAVDLLTATEHATLRRFGDGGQPPVPPWRLLTDPFDEWVARTPDAPAVVCDGKQLTYQELSVRAGALAHRLRGLGVGPDERVGICLEQSTDLAVAMLAVLRAGGAYVPLDPEQPPARLAFLLDDAGAAVVITAPQLAARLPDDRGHVVTQLADESSVPRPEPVATGPDHLAYVIYTSGSTGTPKGVAVQHRQLVKYLAGVRARLAIVDGSRFALAQSLAFDFAVTMFYMALATGGAIHLIPRRSDGRQVADYLAAAGIDYLKITPSHLAALALEAPERDLLPRRALILGGEASRTDWVRRLAGLSAARVINHYGPTEATVGVSTYQVDPEHDPGTVTTPIGRPLPYAKVQVRDRAGRLVPVGAVGEIYLGGDRLAREYLGRPELTAEKFVAGGWAGEAGTESVSGGRWYRTGDLARWLPSGDLEFLGRRDNQVKLRGYRVELGEVEAALTGLPEVATAVVTVYNQTLCAYLEPAEPDVRPGITQLRERLAQSLPEYLLPARAMWLDRIPLMAHGKVDRAALPAPIDVRPDQDVAYAAPAGPVQEAIAAVWRAVLQVDQVGADDDFFDLGGHSLLATQVVSRLRRTLPETARPVTLMDIFKHRTVRALAAVAAGPETPAAGLLHELTRPPAPGSRQLSLVCVPYGGASAVVYQPLADALPERVSLYAVAVPGHDLGQLDRAADMSLPDVAAALTAEVLERVSGPLVLYGHCGPGGALTVELARRLEAAGRRLEAVYLGGIFPFARPTGPLGRLAKRVRLRRLSSDTVHANWLQSLGADLGSLDPAERRHLIRVMRQDAENAEDYFTELFSQQVAPLRAPIISVVGERDPGTEYYAERYREWDYLSPRTSLVVIDEAGHYFLKYRAEELATIVTRVHPAIAGGSPEELGRAGRPEDCLPSTPPSHPKATWWLHDPGEATAPAGPAPSLGRFLTVAAGQIVSMTGTALTEFAVPIWAYLDTGSLVQFALFAVVALLPGILVAPLAGALVDRSDRRTALIGSNLAAAVLLGLLMVQLADGGRGGPLVYATLAVLSAVLSVQRLAYMSAVPQLVPKRYLGHANGVVQFGTGTAQFLTPLLAVTLLDAVGMMGVLTVAVSSYLACLVILLSVRFPRTMAWRRRETVLAEIRNGYRYFFDRPGLRAMLMFFITLNAPLAIVVVLLSPLVLSMGTLGNAGQVAMVSAGGAIAGGLLMALWGGPRQRRMRGMLWTAAGLAASAVVIGARPSLPLIAAGAFGFSLALAIVNGIWLTIIHTKVPHRFHARVIALNQMFALSVVALGFLIAPLAGRALEPMMAPGGLLAGSLGAVIGVGDGRGIALLYLLCGLGLATAVAVALTRPVLAHFDRDVPDAEPDDVIGLAAIQARARVDDRRIAVR